MRWECEIAGGVRRENRPRFAILVVFPKAVLLLDQNRTSLSLTVLCRVLSVAPLAPRDLVPEGTGDFAALFPLLDPALFEGSQKAGLSVHFRLGEQRKWTIRIILDKTDTQY